MEQNKQKTAYKGVVEDYTYLNIGEFGRGLLHVESDKGKKRGFISAGLRGRKITYYIDHAPLDPHLFCYIQNQETSIKVILGASQSTFGARPFFYCPGCFKPKRKLYKCQNAFTCRDCLKLTYESSRKSGSHPILLLAHRYYRLMEMSEKVERISYGGKHTRKAKRVMEYAKRLDWTSRRLKATIPT